MVGGGPFSLQPGEWTDDTSMALCLAESLLERGGFDPIDQLTPLCAVEARRAQQQQRRCFDVGVTVHVGARPIRAHR